MSSSIFSDRVEVTFLSVTFSSGKKTDAILGVASPFPVMLQPASGDQSQPRTQPRFFRGRPDEFMYCTGGLELQIPVILRCSKWNNVGEMCYFAFLGDQMW